MRSSPELVAIDTTVHSSHVSVHAAISTLVELTERVSSTRTPDSPAGSSSEEVLLDTEVNGSRYLLVRMPSINRLRVQLSPREQEIGRMVAKGHPNKVIADVLNISSWTVCTHLRRMFAKLGVGSRAAMVAQLLEMGVFAPEHRTHSGPRQPV
jgi:DNA-binding CsgD family transcriptional regulator